MSEMLITRAHPTNWPVVLMLVGAGYCVTLQAGKLPAAIPALQSEFGVSILSIGWLVSAVAAVAACIGVFIGSFVHRFGARRMLLWGLALGAAGSALGAVSPNVHGLMLSRIIEGGGFIAAVVAVPPLLMSVSRSDDIPKVMASWTTYYPVGMGLMLILAPPLIQFAGWRSLWWMNAAVIGGWLLLIRRVTHRSTPAPIHNPALISAIRQDLAEMLRARSPLWLAVSFAAYAGQFLAIMAFLPLLLSQTAQLSPAAATWITAAVVFSNGLGNVLAGRGLGRWISIFAAIAVAGAVMALGSFLVFSANLPVWVRLAGVFMFSFVGGAIPAATFARAAAMPLSLSSRAATIGLLVQGAAIGQFAGPPLLAAVIGEAGAWSEAPLYTIGCASICVLAAYKARGETPQS